MNKTLWQYTINRKKVMTLGEEQAGMNLRMPKKIVKVCKEMGLHNACQEVVTVFMLGPKNNLMGTTQVSIGLVDRCMIHAREVFRAAIMQNAIKIVLVHNHPSGDSTPSVGDIECTHDLVKAGDIIGILMADHIIIGDLDKSMDNYTSMKTKGILS